MTDATESGFTLPELLIVLAIAALLLAAGAPHFSSYRHNRLVAATASEFQFALNLARSEAIQRAGRVDLAPRDGKHWESGWVVFVNPTDDGNTQFDAGDTLLFSHDKVAAGLRIDAVLRDSTSAYIAYNGSGRTRSNSSGQLPQLGSWKFSLGDKARVVRVGFLGRARLCNPAVDRRCAFAQDVPGATSENN